MYIDRFWNLNYDTDISCCTVSWNTIFIWIVTVNALTFSKLVQCKVLVCSLKMIVSAYCTLCSVWFSMYFCIRLFPLTCVTVHQVLHISQVPLYYFNKTLCTYGYNCYHLLLWTVYLKHLFKSITCTDSLQSNCKMSFYKKEKQIYCLYW